MTLIDLSVGDVFKFEKDDTKFVLVNIKNNEGIESCSYDREFHIVELDRIVPLGCMDYEYFKGQWVQVKYDKGPAVIKCEDEAPFDIQFRKFICVVRKKSKQITIYE